MIGAHREHDRRRRLAAEREEPIDELDLLAGAGPERERLLELIDQHRPRRTAGRHAAQARRQLLGGVGPRAQGDRAPRLGAGEYAGRQRRKEAGAQQRRLPATGRPYYRDQAGLRHAGHQFCHQALAAEEVVGIGGLEPGQALVGATGERGHRHGLPLRLATGQLRPALLEQALDGLDAVGNLSPRGEQPAPRCRQASRGLLDPARRPVPGQGAGLLVDQERDALRQLRHPLDVLGRPAVRLVNAADVGDVLVAEPAEHQLRTVGVAAVPVRRHGPVVAERPEHQHRRRPAPPGEVGDELEGLGAGHVEVVERQQHRVAAGPGRQMAGDSRREIGALAGRVDLSHRRAGAAECLVDQSAGALMCVVAPPVQHHRAIAVRLPGELGDQAGLAGALGAEDRDEPAAAVRGRRPRRPQPPDLAFASHERRADRSQRQR